MSVETAWFGSDKRARTPIVLLHEGLGSLGLWRDFPDRLAKAMQRRVFAYSRKGNGYSSVLLNPRTPNYMHEEALRALPDVLDDHGIRRAVLWGHSDGASIAAIFGGVFPERVQAFVLEAPHLFVEDLSVRNIAAIRVRYETTALRKRIARYHADGDRTFYGWNDVWLDPAFRTWNICAYAARLSAPVLAVQGAEDEYGTIAQIDVLRAAAPNVVQTQWLERCGHSPHSDCPDAVLAAAKTFLAPFD